MGPGAGPEHEFVHLGTLPSGDFTLSLAFDYTCLGHEAPGRGDCGLIFAAVQGVGSPGPSVSPIVKVKISLPSCFIQGDAAAHGECSICKELGRIEG